MKKNFYEELMSRPEKTASDDSLDYRTAKAAIESMDLTSDQMEALAQEITGIFSKTAEEVPVTLEDQVVGGDEANDAAMAAALNAAKAGLDDATSAINTVEALKANEASLTAPVQPAPVVPVPAQAAQATPEEQQRVAFANQFNDLVKLANEMNIDLVDFVKEAAEDSDSPEDEEKSEEPEEKKEDPEENKEEEEPANEKEAAADELLRLLKEGSEEEKEAIVKEAYDLSLVKMANDGITLYDYVASIVGDEKLAADITDMSEKVAYVSGTNYLRVADDIINTMSCILEQE